MARASTRIKNTRPNPIDKVAKSIVPDAQLGRGDFALRDVANHDDDDQRAMIRNRAAERDRGSNKGRQTVRRKTRIERLVEMQIIDRDQAIACQWYADQHCIGYDTVGCTANYGGAGGGGTGKCDFVRSKAQYHARENWLFAREGIPPELIALFDQVVLGQLGENDFRTVTKNEVLRIGIAAWRLHGQVAHLIAISA